MFRMLGKKVELIRYRITWQERGIEWQENCVSEQHKREVEQNLAARGVNFTTQAIDQTGNEWFEGLEFNSYDEAQEVFNAGQMAYEQKRGLQELTDNLKLRADIDYIAIMTGDDRGGDMKGGDMKGGGMKGGGMSWPERIMVYYENGLWSKQMVKNAVGKVITGQEYEDIAGESYN